MDDLDAALARQLQLEEDSALAGAMGAHDGRTQMLNSLESTLSRVQQAEDPELQALALSVMPLDDMREAVQNIILLNEDIPGGQGQAVAADDLLAQELLVWFKTHCFTWVNSPKCTWCGCAETQSKGAQKPTPEEAVHEASRTEVYTCPQCQTSIRFPRYNSVAKLLETRCGRCGEWANAFLLFCRAAGLTARYVWDKNDHVWTEIWSSALGRWVHADSCEAAWDKPLLYEAGWGKAMDYVIAVHATGLVDVTRRYTQQWEKVLERRTAVPEAWLKDQLARMTTLLRSGLPSDWLVTLLSQDAADVQELKQRSRGGLSPADLQGLGARTTGSEAWRQSRGEAGADGASSDGGRAALPSSSTPWVPVPGSLNPGSEVFLAFGRLLGGGCRASGEIGCHERAQSAFDGRAGTKWLDMGAGGEGGTAWLEYKRPGQPPVAVACYDLVSANDSPERDPFDWSVEGWVPGPAPGTGIQGAATGVQGAAAGVQGTATGLRGMPAGTGKAGVSGGEDQGAGSWVTLDQQQGVLFEERHQLRTFWVGGLAAVFCTKWRLQIHRTQHPATANSVQLACWSLYGSSGRVSSTVAVGGGVQELAYGGSVEATAAAAAAALAHPDPGSTLADVGVLRKLLANITKNPHEAKFRRVRASKIASLWRHSSTLHVLAAVGFRPLTLAEPNQEPDVFLVLEAGPLAVARASAASAQLGV